MTVAAGSGGGGSFEKFKAAEKLPKELRGGPAALAPFFAPFLLRLPGRRKRQRQKGRVGWGVPARPGVSKRCRAQMGREVVKQRAQGCLCVARVVEVLGARPRVKRREGTPALWEKPCF